MLEYYDIPLDHSSPQRIEMIQWLAERGYKFNISEPVEPSTIRGLLGKRQYVWRLYDKEAATLFKMFWE